MSDRYDVIVIGGGQAGLAAGYYLRRAKLDFVVLDAEVAPGGAWQHGWDSLHLFSPAEYSTLPGWWMPQQPGHPFPTAGHVVEYLTAYEKRYDLPVVRPVKVDEVIARPNGLEVRSTDGRSWIAKVVVSATGTWRAPYMPHYPGRSAFRGEQLHTIEYKRPEAFEGRRVAVVGGGNSAAQIVADISTVGETAWFTLRPPRFLPDDVDGRVLFNVATQAAAGRGRGVADLGDVVMVPSVLRARDRGAMLALPMFRGLDRDGLLLADGGHLAVDAVVWCTGFRPALGHLTPLRLRDASGRVPVTGTRSVAEPRLHLLGYGNWTGAASATIIGAARTAKGAVAEIVSQLGAR